MIYLILKAEISCMENDANQAAYYSNHSYTVSEKQAKAFCDAQGNYTSKDCWAINYLPYNGIMPKYKYVPIKEL